MQGVARLQGEGPSGPSPFSLSLPRRDPAALGSAFPSADRGGKALRGPSARPPAPSRAAVAGRPPSRGRGARRGGRGRSSSGRLFRGFRRSPLRRPADRPGGPFLESLALSLLAGAFVL